MKKREAKKSASIGSIFFAGMKEDKIGELSRAMAYRELSAVESIVNNLTPDDKGDKDLLAEVIACCLANIKYEINKNKLETIEKKTANANFVYWTMLTIPLLDKLGLYKSDKESFEDLMVAVSAKSKYRQLEDSLSRAISSNYNSSPEASETILRSNSPVKTINGEVVIDPVVMRSVLLIYAEKAHEKFQESERNGIV